MEVFGLFTSQFPAQAWCPPSPARAPRLWAAAVSCRPHGEETGRGLEWADIWSCGRICGLGPEMSASSEGPCAEAPASGISTVK